MSENTLAVSFYGQPIIAIEHNGQLYVAMRPICENIGLAWSPQRKRIMRHQILKTCVVMMTTQMLNDDQRRDYLCLPLSMLNGWLFGVEVNRVRAEIRPTLVRYQQECFQVLFEYWRNHGCSPESPQEQTVVDTPSNDDTVPVPQDVANAVSELLKLTADSKLVGLALVSIDPDGSYKADYHGACVDSPEVTIGGLYRLMNKLSEQADRNCHH